MKKVIIIICIIIFVLGLIGASYYVFISNAKDTEEVYTEKPIKKAIGKEIVATGKIIPEEEIEIKPNISGIIDRLLVVEGEKVTQGQLIATIRVVPQVSELNNAMQTLNSFNITLQNEKRNFNRQRQLLSSGVISRAEYEIAETSYKMAQQNVSQAKKQIQIIQTGVAPGLENVATTQIRATASGVVLEVPIEKGDQVIEANSFNPGTTVAKIADISKMIFEGIVDEAEAGKLKEGMPLKITVGALPDEVLNGNLIFISPQGKDVNGAVQFEIKANVLMNDSSKSLVRAGYSANAKIQIGKEKKVLAIKEALIQYEEEKTFVNVKQKDGSFKKVEVVLGTSDNVFVEVKSGLKESDEIKVISIVSEEIEKKK